MKAYGKQNKRADSWHSDDSGKSEQISTKARAFAKRHGAKAARAEIRAEIFRRKSAFEPAE